MPIVLRRKPALAGLVSTTAFILSAAAALASLPPARGKMVAVDKRTGRAAWETLLWSRSEAAVPPLVTDDLVYVLEDGTTLKALDAASGHVRWQAPVASHVPLTLVDTRVVAVTDEAAIAFDRRSGLKVWEFSLRLFPEWKFDANTIPVVAPGRLLLPAGTSLIAIDTFTGQPCWAYTATSKALPLRPVVVDRKVYLSTGPNLAPVCLKLDDGLPDTGEYALPPARARARARALRAEQQRYAAERRSGPSSKQPFVPVHASVTPGGRSLAAAGAKQWRYPAPPGWTIERIAGESPGELFALLEAAGRK